MMQICEVTDNFVRYKDALIQEFFFVLDFKNEMLNCTNIKCYVCIIIEHSLRIKNLSSKKPQGQQINNYILK